ncbi:hypothetical protein HaLaN_32043, partial [Haematococcus lacustris]
MSARGPRPTWTPSSCCQSPRWTRTCPSTDDCAASMAVAVWRASASSWGQGRSTEDDGHPPDGYTELCQLKAVSRL